MLIELEFPPAWFRDFDSWEMCRMLKVPVINAVHWVSSKDLPLEAYVIAPQLSQLEIVAEENKLHVLKFKGYDTYYIHPTKLSSCFKRNFKRKISRALRE